MIPDLDIYRTANVLVKHHGQDAPIEAAMRADATRRRLSHLALMEHSHPSGMEALKRRFCLAL